MFSRAFSNVLSMGNYCEERKNERREGCHFSGKASPDINFIHMCWPCLFESISPGTICIILNLPGGRWCVKLDPFLTLEAPGLSWNTEASVSIRNTQPRCPFIPRVGVKMPGKESMSTRFQNWTGDETWHGWRWCDEGELLRNEPGLCDVRRCLPGIFSHFCIPSRIPTTRRCPPPLSRMTSWEF